MKNSAIKKIALKYISKVKNKGVPIKSAYLYGSYAKGTAHKDSDIDICVVSPVFGKDYFKENLNLKMISSNLDLRISPVVFNPKDFGNKYDGLAMEIKKHGISLTD